LEDQNEPALGTSQGNGAFLGHELEAKARPSTWTNMWVNKKANQNIWVGWDGGISFAFSVAMEGGSIEFSSILVHFQLSLPFPVTG